MDKWTNADAGPRQIKDLNKVMSALHGEGKTRDELSGVIGGKEHTAALMSLMGPVRPEVLALDEAIRVKYDYTITRQNIRAIIADYAAALPEARTSRPVDDNRRSAEEDAEITARMAAQDAEVKAQRDAANAILNQVMAKKPAGAKALIIAEYHVDASDVMTDYFASHTRRTVAIGWRYSSREDFKALHTAARQFSETAGTDFTEHRDNHSMGAGNYLSDHGWAGAGTGWLIKSRDLPCTYLSLSGDALPEHTGSPSAPSGTGAGGVTVSPSSLGREGVVEIRFADKPDSDVLSQLKARGFRWARGNRCWYGSDTAYADSLL